MDTEIAELQAILKLDTASDAPATFTERLGFIWWSFIAGAFSKGFFIGPYILLAWLLLR